MTEHMLFPFKKIKKDSRIVIYGAGDMGSKILKFISLTKYCEVICILDKNHETKTNFPFKVIPPNAVTEVAEYSWVLITILLESIADEAKKTLIGLDVPEEKIICLNRGFELSAFAFTKPKYLTWSKEPSLSIAFVLCGGLGDEIVASILIKEIRKVLSVAAQIDCYCTHISVFSQMPFIDNVYSISSYDEENNYDATFNVRRFVSFEKINLEKIKGYSKILYDFCIDSIDICNRISGWVFNDNSYTDYCLLKEKRRLEHSNPHNILPFDRNTPTFLKWDERGFCKLNELGLWEKKYITVCNNAGDKSTHNSKKLWPAAYFERLIALIKEKHPNLTVVWLGKSYDYGRIENADIDLIGQTSFSELCVMLKHSLLNIGIEGGIVHLQHFLNGKSACLFGSTDIDVYGYDENINIKSNFPEKCSRGCEWVTSSWLDGGCFISEKPLCMNMLEPETVYERIALFLEDAQEYSYVVEKMISFDDADCFCEYVDSVLSSESDVAVIGRRNDEKVFEATRRAKSITVYSEDLSIITGCEVTKPINCLYAEAMKKRGITAEYGFIYNIPAKDGMYDIVFNLALQETGHPNGALRETQRITKMNGLCVLLINGSRTEYLREFLRLFNRRDIELPHGKDVIISLRKRK